MVTRVYPLRNLEKTVTLPIVRGIISDLMHVFNIPKESLLENHIMTSGEINKFYSLNNGNNRYTELASTKVEFDYKEGIDLDNLSRSIDDVKNIFLYNKNDFKGSLSTVSNNLNITMKFSSRNESDVTLAVNSMRYIVLSGLSTLRHTIKYYFYPDSKITRFLQDLKEILDEKYGKVVDIKDFTSLFAKNGLSLATDVTGGSDNASLVVRKEIKGIIGEFIDMLDVEATYDRDKGLYSVEVDYKISYDRPLAVTLQYEPTINNTVLKDGYLDDMSISNEAFNEIVNCQDNGKLIDLSDFYSKGTRDLKMINIPSFDRYGQCSDIGNTFMSILVVKDVSNVLFNLKDLGDYTINPLFIEYIERVKEKVFEPYESIFLVELIVDNIVTYGKLSINDDLDIIIDDMKDVSRYRVRLSIVNDVSNMNLQQAPLRASFEVLTNRRVLTSLYVSRCLKTLGIPEDILTDIVSLINPSDYSTLLHMYTDDRSQLTVLVDSIDSLTNKIKYDSYLNDTILSQNTNHLTEPLNIIDKVLNHYRWDYNVSNLEVDYKKVTESDSYILYDNIEKYSDKDGNPAHYEIEILKLETIMIINMKMGPSDRNIRVISNGATSVLVDEGSIYIIKDKVYSLTNLSRFTDLFYGHLTTLEKGSGEIPFNVMVSSLSISNTTLTNIKDI